MPAIPGERLGRFDQVWATIRASDMWSSDRAIPAAY